jgi:hypothetical protein
MITLPEDFHLGLQKVEGLPTLSLGLRTNEDEGHGRVGFINRKQDRFTFSIRYYYAGVTRQGKRWGKWQNLNAFSATLKNGRLNLFMIGNLRGRVKFVKVRNITRQPYLIQKAFHSADSSVDEFLQKEFDLLYKRNNLQSVFSADKSFFRSEIMKACYPAWHELHYKEITQLNKMPIPPLFVTDIMREPTIELAIKRLTTDMELQLQKSILKDRSEPLTNEDLWILAVSKKRLTELQRIGLLSKTEPTDSKKGNFNFIQSDEKNNLMYSLLTADDLAQARNLLKPLPQDSIFSVVKSGDPESLLNAVNFWRANKTIFKIESLKLTPENNLDWRGIAVNIKTLQAKTYPTSTEQEQKAIEDLLRGLHGNSSGLFKITESKNYRSRKMETVLTGSISDRYYHSRCLPLNIVQSTDESYYVLPFASNMDITKSTYFSILKQLDLRSNQQGGTSGGPIHLSTENYHSFLNELVNVAKKELTKYHLETSPENISLYVSSLHTLTHAEKLDRFNGILPAKWFNLTRKGLSPFSALLFLEKRVAIKEAINFVDVPDSWVLQAFGLEDSAQEEIFL